jgi:hypothetical protein
MLLCYARKAFCPVRCCSGVLLPLSGTTLLSYPYLSLAHGLPYEANPQACRQHMLGRPAALHLLFSRRAALLEGVLSQPISSHPLLTVSHKKQIHRRVIKTGSSVGSEGLLLCFLGFQGVPHCLKACLPQPIYPIPCPRPPIRSKSTGVS